MVVANRITITAKTGKESELRTLLNALAQQSQEEKGCLKYELYQLEEERHLFFIIEIWKSKKAHQAHVENSVYTEFLTKTADLTECSETVSLKLTQCRTKLGFDG